MIVQKLNLNLIPDDEVRVIHLNQYDTDKAALEFTIFKGSSLFDLTGCSVRIEGTKTDGKGYSYAGTVEGTVARFDVTGQMTIVAGKHRAEVRIRKGEDDIGTANITFDIEPAGLRVDTDMSETDLPEIMELGRSNAEEAAQYASLAQERALQASGYAEDAADYADKAERLTIRNVTATVDNKTGTPSVDVTQTGDTEKTFKLAFHNLKGDKGDQGERGLQGIQGEKGDKGDTGATGPKGDKGDTGSQGPKGDKGDTGPQGAPGIDGTVAFDDLTEEQRLALKGEKGDTGEQGPQGERGEKGAKGDKGSTGFAPVVVATPYDDGVMLSVVNETGATSAFIKHGAKGDKGDSGFTPTISATTDDDGVTITITNETGTSTVHISNGGSGEQGRLKKVLAAGSTELTFSSDKFSEESLIEVYTSNGMQYTGIQQSGNTLTLTFPKQDEDVNVIVRW